MRVRRSAVKGTLVDSLSEMFHNEPMRRVQPKIALHVTSSKHECDHPQQNEKEKMPILKKISRTLTMMRAAVARLGQVVEHSNMHLPRPVILVPTLLALLAFAVVRPATAQAPSIFVIAASDGYGIGDCLAEGGSCGQIVADAWCVAHGAGHAVSFGPAAEFTAAGNQPAGQISPGSLVISCGG
jgi:hypothetical protein